MKKLAGIFILLSLVVNFVAAESIARVMKAQGAVMLKRLGGVEFSESAVPGAAIENGDALQVGADGFAVVVFIDDRSVIKVKENTEFEFLDSDNTRTLKIENGTLLNKIAEQGRTKSFRIETPTSVASVKGTEFTAIVNTLFGVDQFLGSSGLVEVLNVISQQIVSISAGQKAISNAAGAIIQAPAMPNEYPEDPEETVEPEAVEEEVIEEEPAVETETVTPTEVEPLPGEVEMTPEEAAPEAEPKADKPYGLGLGIGSVTIDGIMYNQFALRPEFSFGKLGIGLDVVLYIDNEGNFRKDDWDIKNNPGMLLDKILYLSWAKKGDPFWARVGSLPSVTLGYGGLLNGYSNMMEYPSVRQTGVNAGMRFMKKIDTEIFLSNIKDFMRGGTIMGLRGSYKLAEKLPLTFGANLVVDMNQFSGLKDLDGDDIPDVFDDFDDNKKLWNDTDGDGLPDPHPGLDTSQWDIDANNNNTLDIWAGGTDDPRLKAQPLNTAETKASIIGIAFDVGYPVFANKIVAVDVYSEFNQLIVPEVTGDQYTRDSKTGTGITVPGIRASLFKMVQLNLEYRIKMGYFVPRFFDQSYDISRVITQTDANDSTIVLTKDKLVLNDDATLSGYFGAFNWDIFGFANLGASYANMKSDTVKVRSFAAVLGLNTDWIPKLSEASAYYMRNNDANPFDFKNPTVNTIIGYRLGYEVSPGVSLVWNFSQFYRDAGEGLKPVRQTTIETAFDL
ncbi:MAG: FecR family protein [Candidatus Neomarinimicrobiota bacterium]